MTIYSNKYWLKGNIERTTKTYDSKLNNDWTPECTAAERAPGTTEIRDS